MQRENVRDIEQRERKTRLITRTLYYSKDMESFATGLKRIYDACETAECKVEFLKELPNVHYVGSGYSGYWEIDGPEE